MGRASFQLPADPAAPGATVRRRPHGAGRAGNAPAVTRAAVRRFNRSQAARTVAGLTRTLGAPRASLGAAAGSPTLIRITVAWDLCWYQWGVDLADGSRPVFELARGAEVGELDVSARQWNASAEDGRLRLGTAR